MINYLGTVKYGIWSTLLSIVLWVLMFDFGVANGLRNKISESLAKNNPAEAREYISTTYFFVTVFAGILILILFLVTGSLDWQNVFNTKSVSNDELVIVIRITIFFILINFILSLINQIFHGVQKTGFVNINQAFSNLLSFCFVYFLSETTNSSLVYLSIAYGLAIFFANIIVSFFYYSRNKELKPTFQSIKKDKVKSILSLGLRFFIVQIAAIVLFTTDKILITQLFGPDYVTSYDLIYKLFGFITLVHALLLSPLWSSFSQAFLDNDISWIKKIMKYQIKLLFIMICCVMVLIWFCPIIISLWVGDIDYIDYDLYSLMGVYVVVLAWNNIFSMFINATGYLKISMIITSIISLLNIPLSLVLVKCFGFGMNGILLSTIMCLLIGSFLGPLQYVFVIRNRGSKIWFS